MVGVLVYVVIGFVLFTPIGVIAGFIQHRNSMGNPNDFHPMRDAEKRSEE